MNAENPAITHAKMMTIRRIPPPAIKPAAFLASGVGFTSDVLGVADVVDGGVEGVVDVVVVIGVVVGFVVGVVVELVVGVVDVGAEGGATLLSSYFSNGANIYILFRQIKQTKLKKEY